MSVEAQGEVLLAYSKGLQRELHNLTPHPNFLWQQLHNRLQWVEGMVAERVAAERKRRCGHGVQPWARMKTRIRESQALIRTLASHTDLVNYCAISYDGTFIVSASNDKTLKVWDAATGAERATLAGHTAYVRACAISPDGALIVSASYDKTLKIWDAATGAERATLAGHTGSVNACAISPDGALIVSASWDRTLKIWDARSGEPIGTFPCLGLAFSCAFIPSGVVLAAGDSGGCVYILEWVGDVPYGPIMVTAVSRIPSVGHALTFRCPACLQEHPINQEQLGSELTCPTLGCGASLKLNQFMVRTGSQASAPAMVWIRKALEGGNTAKQAFGTLFRRRKR